MVLNNQNQSIKIKPPLPKSNKIENCNSIQIVNVQEQQRLDEDVIKLAEEGIATIEKSLPRSISPIIKSNQN